MSGFDTTYAKEAVPGLESVTTNSQADLTADEIAGLVARGHHIRALHLQAWGKHVMQTLASLWRRPGRLTSAAPLRSR